MITGASDAHTKRGKRQKMAKKAKPKVKYLSLNGEVVPWAEATVHILSPAMKYAANVFEGIRGYWNADEKQMYIFRLEEHLRRLQFSMKVMRYEESFSVAHLRDCIIDLIRANKLRQNTYIRLFAYVDAPDGDMTAGAPVGLAIAATPRDPHGKAGKGMNVQISSWLRLPETSMPPRIKCVANYNNSRLAWAQARMDGYDNAILMTQKGTVSEGPGACLFIVRDGVPVTSSLTSDILESITRDTVIRLSAEYFDLEAEQRDIGRTELYAAEEAFYAGTGHEILPISSIDRMAVGTGDTGPLTQKIMDTYAELVEGAIPDHPEWRTPVYDK
jgi:branched-chain amino acid aminotransferase